MCVCMFVSVCCNCAPWCMQLVFYQGQWAWPNRQSPRVRRLTAGGGGGVGWSTGTIRNPCHYCAPQGGVFFVRAIRIRFPWDGEASHAIPFGTPGPERHQDGAHPAGGGIPALASCGGGVCYRPRNLGECATLFFRVSFGRQGAVPPVLPEGGVKWSDDLGYEDLQFTIVKMSLHADNRQSRVVTSPSVGQLQQGRTLLPESALAAGSGANGETTRARTLAAAATQPKRRIGGVLDTPRPDGHLPVSDEALEGAGSITVGMALGLLLCGMGG